MPDQLSMFDDAPGGDAAAPDFSARRASRPATRHELFFALRPAAEDAFRLVEATGHASRQLGIGGKPLEAARLHVSLFEVGRYVGDAFPDDHVARLVRAAGHVRHAAFDVVFDEVVSFPSARAFVLKASADEAVAALLDFRLRLGEALANAGFDTRDRKVTPHMTLEYGGAAAPATRIPALAWRASEFVLVDSYVGEHHHETLGRWPVAG